MQVMMMRLYCKNPVYTNSLLCDCKYKSVLTKHVLRHIAATFGRVNSILKKGFNSSKIQKTGEKRTI
jgi:hypothetical protein